MWEKLLMPFMMVMSRSSYKQKFLFISILFAVPLIYLTLSWFHEKQMEINHLLNEQNDLEQLSQI